MFRRALLVLVLLVPVVGYGSSVIDLNEADAETLARVLVGVGPGKAAAIVEHRKQHGPFRSVDDLVNVPGIGEKLVEKNRALLVVRGGGARNSALTDARGPFRTDCGFTILKCK